ncbi:MAG: protein-L-isoaspartate(D-aspartate) O-methyltransferase [Planctomycetaceae bacterium]
MLSKDQLLSAKRRMIEQHLRARGITDERVLAAMERVPREEFVPDSLRGRAYDDRALPIEFGQTISQPYTVAFMAQAARLQGHERVLEIGTGTGYGAAVLSHLAAEVGTVERWPELFDSAKQRLERLGFQNVITRLGDGSQGWIEQAPFEAIVVTAAAPTLPTAFRGQLSEGGRLIIPIGEPGGGQTMFRFTRRNGKWHEEELGLFSFVPLVCSP